MSAPVVYLDRLLWVLLQLFLVGSVAANYFDEIRGRPWRTKMAETYLWAIGLLALSTSSLIGIYLTLTVAWWFWFFVAVWGFFAVAYGLELFDGRFHNTPFLALSWGSVCLGSYYLQSLTITPQILMVSLIAGCIAGRGRELYEAAKPVYRDKDPSAHEASRSTRILKVLILFIDIIAMTMLTYKLLFQL